MSKYKRENCTSLVRMTITNHGQTITLVGKHSYEWSIVVEDSGTISITTFPNRKMAKKYFENYKRSKL